MPYNNPYFSGGSPGSAGAAGFMKGLLDAYGQVAGVQRGREASELNTQQLAETQRQFDAQRAFQEAQIQNIKSQVEARNAELQNFQAYQKELGNVTGQNQQAMYSPGIETPIQPPAEMSPAQRAAIIAKFYPAQAVQAAALPGEIQSRAAQTQYLQGPRTANTQQNTAQAAAQTDILIPAQATHLLAQTQAMLTKEPNPDKLTPEIKNFFAARGFSKIFTDYKELQKAQEYLDSPTGRQDFQNFYSWLKIPYTPVVSNEGISSLPGRTPMPAVPGAGGGMPIEPGTKNVSPLLQARPVIGSSGERLKKPIDTTSTDAFNALMEIGDSFNAAKIAMAENPGVTGPGASLYNSVAETIPGIPVQAGFQKVAQPLKMLYDIVYGKSGKQINENELKIIKGYTPQPGDKFEVITFKMQNFERHLYSLIYNRAMNAQTNGMAIPESVQPMVAQAVLYFRANKINPVAGFGLAPIGGKKENQTPSSIKPERTVVNTGMYQGKKVIKYSDGSVEYGQ